jgi:hypothetical protein
VRVGAAYDIAVLRPWRGAVAYPLFGPAVDLKAEAVVGPGILLVVELDRTLAVDGGVEVGVLAGVDVAAFGRVRTPVIGVLGFRPYGCPVGVAKM